MFRIASIILVAMLTLQAVGQEQQPTERRSVRGPAGAKGGGREQRRPGADQDIMMGQALRNPRMAEKLGLSEEQQQAIEGQLAELQKAHNSLRAGMEQAGLQQARLMMAEELDEAALMAAVEETGRIRTELAKLRIRHLLFMRKTLTPEQIKKARSAIRDKMKKHREEGSKGRGPKKHHGEGKKNQGQRDREASPEDAS